MSYTSRIRSAAASSASLAIAVVALLVPQSAGAQDPDSVRSTARPPASADGAPGGPANAAVVSRVQSLLDADMPVTASRTLARELSLGVIEGFDAVILAARAHAEQRSWGTVRRLIVGRDWTDPALESEALLLLATAYRGLDSASRAVEIYEAYLAGAPDPVPAVVRVDHARALLGSDRPADAAEQLALAAADHPDIARWASLSRLNSLVRAEDPAAFALADSLARVPLVPADSAWRAAAQLAFRLDDPARGVSYANRASGGVRREMAERHIVPHLLATGDTAAAVAALRSVIERGRAAAGSGELLEGFDGSWRTLRNIGESDVRNGRTSRAIRYFTRALEGAPAASQPGIALSLGEAHRALGRPGRALEAITPWLGERPASSEELASLWLLAARAHTSMGDPTSSAEAYRKAAAGSGTSAALAAYLTADAHHDAGRLDQARTGYELASGRFPGSSYGSRSLERLALLHFHEGRLAEARARLLDYRQRYPEGDWSQGAIYWIGKTYEAEGDTAAAQRYYADAVVYNPIDYYAILASSRVSRDRWQALGVRDAASVPPLSATYSATLERMNRLRELGWVWRARWEYRAARENGPGDWQQVLAFAHALNENGWTREGIAEGWRAKSKHSGWTRPLLQAIYPLPFPQALAHAALDRGLSPHFVAGLSRRESLFDPEIRSVANAVGIMQLLPETARDVAPRAGLSEYRRSQLTVPQVNLLLGTRYLADMLARFGEQKIAGMISYNAGPHRFVRWREFPEFTDDETAVERIPFKETREYVRAVTELTEIYRYLYPELGSNVP